MAVLRQSYKTVLRIFHRVLPKACMTYPGPINMSCAFSFIPCTLVMNSNAGINQVYGVLVHHHNAYGCHTRHDSDLPQNFPIHKVT